ncbi:hypothetical protein CYL31_09465 [Marinomonas sp. A3A]|jgi:hypothetical protein|uniref:hypothetical protein n=1 Tax=Marinomonas sp. A3A TaxID=2065312 RepID=UPI001BB399B6|nr:hypothetical protein [Marinomonas sp. A3A]QUX91624.1 hypothetical protein CYL31_09465 [Marinomonas sp. A3A]
MTQLALSDLIGKQVLGVAGTYGSRENAMDVYICGVNILSDTSLELFFPNGHQLKANQKVTVHLDNRTGVSEYDADLKVYRSSFKGIVASTTGRKAQLTAIEYEVYYGASIVKSFQADNYEHPSDNRPAVDLPYSPLTVAPEIDDSENDNKIGVLMTFAKQQPHSTVMAFLSSVDDDIFFITFPSTFKAKLLSRNNQCYFAIDGRATFTFEEAIEWNYSIIKSDVYEIPKSNPVFQQIQELFIQKNPWEMGFFSHPEVTMYHLKATKVVCPKQSV